MPAKLAPDTLEDSLALLHAHPAIVEETGELLPLLDDRSDHLTYPLDEAAGVAAPHPALGARAPHPARRPHRLRHPGRSAAPPTSRPGVFRDERTNSDLFFVTLEKSERDYSPSTLYKDYAISPTRLPLGVAVRDLAAVADRAALHPAPGARRAHPAVRAAEAEAGRPDDAVHVPGAGGLRVAQGRPADQLRVAAAAADAGGFVQGGEGGGGLSGLGRLTASGIGA